MRSREVREFGIESGQYPKDKIEKNDKKLIQNIIRLDQIKLFEEDDDMESSPEPIQKNAIAGNLQGISVDKQPQINLQMIIGSNSLTLHTPYLSLLGILYCKGTMRKKIDLFWNTLDLEKDDLAWSNNLLREHLYKMMDLSLTY
jgi:hypothetical protein